MVNQVFLLPLGLLHVTQFVLSLLDTHALELHFAFLLELLEALLVSQLLLILLGQVLLPLLSKRFLFMGLSIKTCAIVKSIL